MKKAPMTIRELRVMTQAVADKTRRDVAAFKGNQNPQVIEMLRKAESELYLAEAVLSALGGDRVPLRMMGRSFDD